MKKILWKMALVSLVSLNAVYAGVVNIPMSMVNTDGKDQNIGTIIAEDSKCGVLLTPNLHNLPPGVHGFHIHEKPACGDRGMAAGPHLDPAQTKRHQGPYNVQGHLGDLPVLVVNSDGTATLPMLAPKITVAELKGHALMIHASPDNYANQPENGGSGPRMACGVIG